MRKKYIAPSLKMVICKTEAVLTVSGIYSSKGIRYGGVDEDGDYEAD